MEAAAKTILLVEDDLETRVMIGDALGQFGYRILVAGNGREALHQLARDIAAPDLIILDWMMPVMSGLEFLTFLTADREHRRVPVLVLSALDRALNVNHAPVAAVLTKPVRIRMLRDVVSRLCGVVRRDPAELDTAPIPLSESPTVRHRRPSSR